MPNEPHPETRRFRAALANSGLPRKQAALSVGYHPHYFYMLEKGLRRPGNRLLAVLEERFGIAERSIPLHHVRLKQLELLIDRSPLTDGERESAAARILEFGMFLLKASPPTNNGIHVLQQESSTMKTAIDRKSAPPNSSLYDRLDQLGLGYLMAVEPAERKHLATQVITLLQQVAANPHVSKGETGARPNKIRRTQQQVCHPAILQPSSLH